ncbi:unnamed protein product [Polarella glacialis]|uniref:Uncharacterized protein n=1 Tax=Polarella glacialis TaxID=89957 RepID=A0A813FKH6_POLGL|nr:unnamed protein product [Polarella glacialis]
MLSYVVVVVVVVVVFAVIVVVVVKPLTLQLDSQLERSLSNDEHLAHQWSLLLSLLLLVLKNTHGVSVLFCHVLIFWNTVVCAMFSFFGTWLLVCSQDEQHQQHQQQQRPKQC